MPIIIIMDLVSGLNQGIGTHILKKDTGKPVISLISGK
ncbi:hypothetical protein HMPREF0378_0230 [Eubacterium nodatum ATCC 33099]|nr:hypothetical protein HMPREF0378_0230 [Eubacterium nodatum ATCC 33099]